jgi:hypothetical protein
VACFLYNGRTEAYTQLFIDAEQPEGLPLVPARILKSAPVTPLSRSVALRR